MASSIWSKKGNIKFCRTKFTLVHYCVLCVPLFLSFFYLHNNLRRKNKVFAMNEQMKKQSLQTCDKTKTDMKWSNCLTMLCICMILSIFFYLSSTMIYNTNRTTTQCIRFSITPEKEAILCAAQNLNHSITSFTLAVKLESSDPWV